MDAETLVGPLHARAGVDKFVQAVKEVKEQGGEILVGGNVRTMEGALGGGNWVEPTIAFFGKEGAPVMKRETFAPSESARFSCEEERGLMRASSSLCADV